MRLYWFDVLFFSFSLKTAKQGRHKYRKRQGKRWKFSEDQQQMFDGLNEAINNKERTVHVKTSEDENINYSESVTLSSGMSLTFSFDKMEKLHGKDEYQAGQTMQMPFDTENAFVVINRKDAKTSTSEAEGGGQTKASESPVFIHEVLCAAGIGS